MRVKSYLNFVLMLLLLVSMAFTKMQGLALAPVLFFFLLLLYCRTVPVKFVIFLLVAGLAFSTIYLTYSGEYIFLLNQGASVSNFVASSIIPKLGDYINHVPYTYLRLFNYPPNECLNQNVFGIFNDLLKLLFIIITFPFFILCVKGVISGFKDNLFWKMLSSAVAFNFSIIVLEFLGLTPFILPRYLIPTIALTGLLAAKEYANTDKLLVRRVMLVSFVLFAAYSLSYSTYSTVYHRGVYDLHMPSIEFVSNLPEEDVVIASFMTGRIEFYSHRNTHQYLGDLDLN